MKTQEIIAAVKQVIPMVKLMEAHKSPAQTRELLEDLPIMYVTLGDLLTLNVSELLDICEEIQKEIDK